MNHEKKVREGDRRESSPGLGGAGAGSTALAGT